MSWRMVRPNHGVSSGVADYRVRPQGKISTYARVQKFKSERNACKVSIQYKQQAPWVPWCRITMVGDDRTGLTLEEIQNVLADCPDHQISLVELAFDFHPDTLVDESFVLSNCRFGKAKLNKKRRATGYLRYGGRSSPKLVRCYPKLEIGRYRVELETHSVFLRKRKINTIVDLPKIVDALYPNHISFRAMKWKKLEAHLRGRYGKVRAAELIDQARECADVSLRRATRFLSKSVYNVHRFWGSEATNRDVREALKRWVEDFSFNKQSLDSVQ